MSILPSRVMESAILTLLVVGVELAQKSPTRKDRTKQQIP